MCKVEYTDENRRALAEDVVNNMDMGDMMQALYEQELECYEQDEDTFQELWHNYYGNEDTEMTDKYLEHFVYLDKLRESGRINMAGAPRELREHFDVDKAEAVKIFELWTAQFSAAKNPEQYTQREEDQNE